MLLLNLKLIQYFINNIFATIFLQIEKNYKNTIKLENTRIGFFIDRIFYIKCRNFFFKSQDI